MLTGSIVYACAVLNKTITVPSKVIPWHNLHINSESWFFYFWEDRSQNEGENAWLVKISVLESKIKIFSIETYALQDITTVS